MQTLSTLRRLALHRSASPGFRGVSVGVCPGSSRWLSYLEIPRRSSAQTPEYWESLRTYLGTLESDYRKRLHIRQRKASPDPMQGIRCRATKRRTGPSRGRGAATTKWETKDD